MIKSSIWASFAASRTSAAGRPGSTPVRRRFRGVGSEPCKRGRRCLPISFPAQLGEAQLAECLIGENSDRVGQVQAAGLRPHGDAEAPVWMGLPEPQGQAGGFLAEKEPASVPKLGLGVIPRCLGGGQPKVRNLVFVKEVLYAIIDAQVHHVPIIQPRPLHCPVADVKAQGADQMQTAAGGGAGAGDISRQMQTQAAQ